MEGAILAGPHVTNVTLVEECNQKLHTDVISTNINFLHQLTRLTCRDFSICFQCNLYA